MSLFSCLPVNYPGNIQNKIYSARVVRLIGATDVPVALSEAKDHLHVTFTDDDTYITALIAQAVDSIERYCSISILQKTVTVAAELYNFIELPYGPLLAFTSYSYQDGNVYTLGTTPDNYLLDGSLFTALWPGRVRIVYNTGYDAATNPLPAGLKLAILNEIAFRYENRGDSTSRYASQNVGISEGAEALAQPFRNLSWQ
ncbi:MAG: phage head-tail connector protein [Taibaiella sp.]|nr:phage head-tail connector protein [Taibaiella sp.]